jgi:hypothetical protein
MNPARPNFYDPANARELVGKAAAAYSAQGRFVDREI